MRKHIDGTLDLEPIVKWPGGKEKELQQIIDHVPAHFDTFYEPFVGGGSVFMAIIANQYMINDLSEELINLYSYIQNENAGFFNLLNNIVNTWQNAHNFTNRHAQLLSNIYISYRNNEINYINLCDSIDNFIEQNNNEAEDILIGITQDPHILTTELRRNLKDKMRRINNIEHERGILNDNDLFDNIETSVKGSVYMYYRHIYNHTNINTNPILKTALFYFLRNYAYSGMFRYSANGHFNVPYGGIAYNSKNLTHKIEYYQSEDVRHHFETTNIFNLDFEDFVRNNQPANDDFMFLDPPYDTEFSTYNKNEFNQNDQERLANYLIHECPCQWMLIIKRTDFIHELYANHPNIHIMAFDKRYVVSFKNRNEQNTTHLLITNYNIEL